MSSEMKVSVVPRKGNKSNKKSKDFAVAYSPQVSLPAAHNYVPPNQVFKFTQSWTDPNHAVSSVTVPTFTASTFTMGSLDQVASLAAVFDQYRMDEVEVWLNPQASSQGTATSTDGLFSSVIDYDDSNALTTVNQAYDYTNVLTTSGCSGHYRRFKPHVAIAAYSGAFTSFANQESPWIDFASTGVQHYGLKTAWTATTAVCKYDLIVRYHMSCRNIR